MKISFSSRKWTNMVKYTRYQIVRQTRHNIKHDRLFWRSTHITGQRRKQAISGAIKRCMAHALHNHLRKIRSKNHSTLRYSNQMGSVAVSLPSKIQPGTNLASTQRFLGQWNTSQDSAWKMTTVHRWKLRISQLKTPMRNHVLNKIFMSIWQIEV